MTEVEEATFFEVFELLNQCTWKVSLYLDDIINADFSWNNINDVNDKVRMKIGFCKVFNRIIYYSNTQRWNKMFNDLTVNATPLNTLLPNWTIMHFATAHFLETGL